MKFIRFNKGHYRASKNDVIFDILKCRKKSFLFDILNFKEKWIVIYRTGNSCRKVYSFNTLKECKMFANDIFLMLKEFNIC